MYLAKPYRVGLWLLGTIAGILYVSWPLGYWLNPAVSKESLASGLEAVGQPYSWLFVSADIVSSLLIIAVCWMLWLTFRRHQLVKAVPAALMLIAFYGIGTIA